MNEPGKLLEAPELAASDPPRSFSSFALASLTPEAQAGMDYLPWVSFAVSCKACGGDDFRLGSRVDVVPEPSPHPQAMPDHKTLGPPHRLKCERCGATETIFDASTDGYDGILNGGCACPS